MLRYRTLTRPANATYPLPEFGFTGQRYVDSIGIYDYGARWYEPALGRFLSPDSVVPAAYDPQSVNPYSYVRNNPLNRIDPTGNFDLGGVWGGFTGFWGSALGWANQNVFNPTWGFASGVGGWVDTNIFDPTGDFFTGFGSGFARAFPPPEVSQQVVEGSSSYLAGYSVGKILGDDIKGFGGMVVGSPLLLTRGLWNLASGTFDPDGEVLLQGAKDLTGVPFPKYGADTGLFYPGESRSRFWSFRWLSVGNQLDRIASGWHDTKPWLESATQVGWLDKAWRGPDGRFGASDVLGLGPYGQVVRLFGTVIFGPIAGGQRLDEMARDR